jgi:hypothetical protein
MGEGSGAATSTNIESNRQDPYAPLLSFDWESWDGKDFSKIDEKHKPLFEKVAGYRGKLEEKYSSEYKSRADELKQYYIDVLSGTIEIDPAEFKAAKEAADKLTADMRAAEERYLNLENEYTSFQAQVKHREETRYQKWVENFKGKTQDIWSDEAKATTFKGALESGFPISQAVALARGDGKLAAKAIALAKENVPPAKAIEFAKLELAKSPAPNTAAKLVSGAENEPGPSKVATRVNLDAVPVNKRIETALDDTLRRRGLS